MIRNIKAALLSLAATFLLGAVPLAVPAVVSAQTNLQNCVSQGSGLDGSLGSGDCTQATSQQANGSANLTSTFKFIVNVFSVIVGVIAVVMIIWGGLRYITSGGDSGKITSAKNTIIYAVIGLVVVALAQFIVQFVIGKASTAVGG